jgi:biotin carboxyl carrier protein
VPLNKGDRKLANGSLLGATAGRGMKFDVTVADRSFEIEVDHEHLVWVDGQPLYVELQQVGGLPVYSLATDDNAHVLFVEKGQSKYQVEVQGQVHPVEVKLRRSHPHRQRAKCASGAAECFAIRVPLAGRLLSLPVQVGAHVEVGQVVAVVESMKMQMELKAPTKGSIEMVHGPPGRDVGQHEELVILRPEG